MNLISLKNNLIGLFGLIGVVLGRLFGGWDILIQTLILFMVVDYLSGFVVAGLNRSPKTPTGSISSKIGWQGLSKKGITLIFVLVATQLDILLGTDFIRTSVMFPFIVNELVSITENAGLLGVPIPKVITSAIELLKKKGEYND